MASDILGEEKRAAGDVLPDVIPDGARPEGQEAPKVLSIDELAQMSDEDLAKVMDLAGQQKNAPKAEAKDEPKPEPDAEPKAEDDPAPPAEDKMDDPAPKQDDDQPHDGPLPDRIRLNSYDEGDKKIIVSAHRLAKELGISFPEAFDRVRGKTKDEPVPASEKAKEEPAPKATDPTKEPETAEEIEARIAELDAQIAEQTELGDVLEVNKLLAKSLILTRRLAKAEAAAAAETATSEVQFQQGINASRARVLNDFPEFKDEDGPLRQLAMTIQDAWKFRKDPRLLEATAPEQIVNEAASKLGLKPLSQRKEAGGAKPTAPTANGSAAINGAAIPSKPRMNPLAPASAGAGALVGRGGMDRAQMIELAAKMSDDEFAKACQEAGLNRK